MEGRALCRVEYGIDPLVQRIERGISCHDGLKADTTLGNSDYELPSPTGNSPRTPWRRAFVSIGSLLLAMSMFILLMLCPSGGPMETTRHVFAHERISASSLLESEELHEATTDTMMTVGHKVCLPADRQKVRSFVAARFNNLSRSMKEQPPEKLESITLTQAQKREVLQLVRSLGHLKLRSLHGGGRRLATSNGTIYKYDSFNEGQSGTGDLGAFGERSVAQVTLDTSDMTFTIGPRLGGTHLISGKMTIAHKDDSGISGNVTAGFVNLHSTLSGVWHTEGGTFDSTLHVELSDMGINEEWAWYAHNKRQSTPCASTPAVISNRTSDLSED